MLAPHLVLFVLIALGIVWTAGWAMVIANSGRAVPLEELEGSETRVRLWLLGGLAAVAIVLFILTLRWLPYEAARTNEIGPPAMSVAVTGARPSRRSS